MASSSVILEVCVRKEALSTVRNDQSQWLRPKHSDEGSPDTTVRWDTQKWFVVEVIGPLVLYSVLKFPR